MSSSTSHATEFVLQSFETEVTDEELSTFISALDDAVASLRSRFTGDSLLEDVIRRREARQGISASVDTRNQDPEPLTQELIIEPLLETVGYTGWSTEVSDNSDTRGAVVDYSVPLHRESSVPSSQLLIEAEPLNKPLDSRSHGTNQVEDWLANYDFATEFGVATDGFRWVLIRHDADTYTHDRIEEVDLSGIALSLFLNQVSSDPQPPHEVLTEEDRDTARTFLRAFAYDNFVSIAGDAREVIKRQQKAITDEFYKDYVRYVFGVIEEDEDRTTRSLIGDGIVAPDGAEADTIRLFAVKLMDRLIFVKFLEDKHIVSPSLLASLKDAHENGIYTESFYQTFLTKLFYNVMNTKPGERAEQIRDIEFFRGIPYLNGGLFRPNLGEDSEVDEQAFDVVDSVLYDIIDLLEEYEFSADGGPTDIDPSVLGNVFEKTINYLTADAGDANKELGAYYTPSEITRFSAEETIGPAVADRIIRFLEEEDWHEVDVESLEYDTVHELIGQLNPSWPLINSILGDVVDDLRVVDPSCGSGHFLTSVLEEIVRIRKALYARCGQHPNPYRLKKTTVQENIYGVDIVGPAVEIAKLRCWLSIIGELSSDDVDSLSDTELALPNIAFNLRQGNALIGYTGIPDTDSEGENATIASFTEGSVRRRYRDIIDEIDRYEEAGKEGFSEKAESHRRKAFSLLEEARDELIPKIRDEFLTAGVDSISHDTVKEMSPFNWVLEFAEVYADGGFDVIVGNPPWDRIKASRDDFFSRYDPDFRALRGDEKDEREAELRSQGSIASAWEEYEREIEIRSTYFSDGPAYEMQESTVAGRTEASENDLSSLFFERVFDLAREDGYVSLVLPGRIFHGAPTKTLRQHLLDTTSVSSLVSFENHGIFENIDTRYNFGIVTFENTGSTETLRGIFQHQDLDILQNKDDLIEMPREVLTSFAPSSMLFPRIQSKEELEVLRAVVTHPSIADESRAWYAVPFYPLHKTSDKERFFDEPDGCDYPILTGRNFYSYSYDPTFVEDLTPPFQWSVDEDKDPERSAKQRIREKKVRALKRELYEAFDGSGSMKSYVNGLLEEKRGKSLSPEDVRLPSSVYRLGFRRVARGTDERTVISAVVPPGVVCDYSFYIIEPFDIRPSEEDLSKPTLNDVYKPIFSDEELFAALGLLNSIPFDFLISRKIDNSIPIYSFKETQMPDLTEGDDWFEYIWQRAARLNCYGDAFAEMRERLDGIEPAMNEDERRELQAEIDAAAFFAYGIGHKEVKFVLENFHQVGSPRVRDDAYFKMVQEKHDELRHGS